MTLTCQKRQFLLLCLTFTRSMYWKRYIHSIAKAASIKWAPFIGPSISLLPNPSCICTDLPFDHVWSTVPISEVMLQGLMGLIYLVGSGLSADLQALPHTRGMLLAPSCSTSITMGNVPLSLRITYLPYFTVSSTHFSKQMHRHTELSFINQGFLLALQPFGTPPLMNAFNQITISQQSRGVLTRSCC